MFRIKTSDQCEYIIHATPLQTDRQIDVRQDAANSRSYKDRLKG